MGTNYFRGPGGSYINAGEVGDFANDPHGTAVLSKIAGKEFGASKNINAVIVRHAEQYTLSDVVECVTWITNDWISIRNTNLQAVEVAITNTSFHDKVGEHFTATTQVDFMALVQFRDLLNKAVTEGILPICAAGNEGTVSSLADLPTIYADGVSSRSTVSQPCMPGSTIRIPQTTTAPTGQNRWCVDFSLLVRRATTDVSGLW